MHIATHTDNKNRLSSPSSSLKYLYLHLISLPPPRGYFHIVAKVYLKERIVSSCLTNCPALGLPEPGPLKDAMSPQIEKGRKLITNETDSTGDEPIVSALPFYTSKKHISKTTPTG